MTSMDIQQDTESEDNGDRNEGGSNAGVIATHYNTIEDRGLDFRNTSRILYLRNFNNWIKSMLLGEIIDTVTKNKPKGSETKALDLCCGKGGDLLKWKLGNVDHLIFVDIAEISVNDCQKRYSQNKNRTPNIFSAEFIVADVTKTCLREKYNNPNVKLDIVSCQFAFHYCFESFKQAKMMLQNVSDCLKPGGFFIGTIPNAFEIVARHKEKNCDTFGNVLFNIKFEHEITEQFPLFGSKYNFHLEGVVDCPEYLVHFPTFERLAAIYGLKCIKKKRFQNYFEEMRKKGHPLLGRMAALETYPPVANIQLVGKKSEYKHARDYMKEFYGNKHIGTLSMPEWEVASLYMVFAFQKE